jgi:hypothetical protein
MASKAYNGHKNWNYWNVALWISNDEPMYRMAKSYKRQYKNSKDAAEAFVQDLADSGITQTPDGAPYSKSAVQAAIAGL